MLVEKAKEICKLGSGSECCRYLCVGANGFECLKITSMKGYIDRKFGNNEMIAQGDNCDGLEEVVK